MLTLHKDIRQQDFIESLYFHIQKRKQIYIYRRIQASA